MDLREIGAGAARACLDLILRPTCAGCRSAERVASSLCPGCRSAFRLAFRAEAPLAREIPGCSTVAYAATRYDGATRELIVAYKERGRRELRHELGRALLVACLAGAVDARLLLGAGAVDARAGPALLVPAPSKRATIRERGHDAVRDLAAVAARELRRLEIPARVAPVLAHAREVADQAGLGAQARAANVAGAMVARRQLVGQVAIVVDDIITTGATAAEAVRALVTAGARVTCVAAVAATPRRVPAPAESGSTRRRPLGAG